MVKNYINRITLAKILSFIRVDSMEHVDRFLQQKPKKFWKKVALWIGS